MKNKLKILYNPFEWIAGWKAFLIGIIIVLLSVVIADYGNQYYQGAMNIRLVPEANLAYGLLSQGVALLCMVMLFYISGRIFSRGVRFQDVLGTTTLARYPYIIPAFFGYFFDFDSLNDITMTALSGDISGVGGELSLLVIFGFILLIVLIWYIALLWNAFRISTDIKGGKGIVIFIIALIMTDLLYYGIMCLINKLILV
jgi:hypothetical protein